MNTQHPNDVLVHEGWHVVRNEKEITWKGKQNNHVWFSVYHNHADPYEQRLCRVVGRTPPLKDDWECPGCNTPVPDVVQGYMKLVRWSLYDEAS